MEIEEYDVESHKEAVKTMWVEAGWGEFKEGEQLFVETERTLVATLAGQPGAVSISSTGDMRYLDETLPITGIGAVITDLTARRQGLSSRLTAHRIARDAQDGALVAALGAFEDGFYNRLGFGTGAYEYRVSFAPSHLKIDRRARPPQRLGSKDFARIHQARLGRRRGHGGCNFHAPEYTRFEIAGEDSFGFGYSDEAGQLTHYIWLGGKGKEAGPFNVNQLTYQTWDQCFELLALLKSFGDQFHLVTMTEPPDLWLQDWLERPFFHRNLTKGSQYASKVTADAWWQMRILDLPGCLVQTHLQGEPLHLNIVLEDPIEHFLDETTPWRGVGGQYMATIGPQSGAKPGFDPNLPTLNSSVAAFTRLWLGARPAASLAVAGALQGPQKMIDRLDELFRLPRPWPEWDF